MNAVRAKVRRGSGPATSQTSERRGRCEQHDRHEDLGDAIGEALDRRLRPLGALDELDDPRQRRVAPDPVGSHHERAGRIDRCADDLIARPDGDGHRLAGEHRCVDRGAAFDDDTVDRDPLARPDAQEVADTDLLEGDLAFPAILDDPRDRRAERGKPADRAGRPALGPRLEPPPEQDQTDDDGRGVEVGHRLDAGRFDRAGPEGDDGAVGPGRGRADRDERVHVRGAVPCRAPGRAVERATGPELDERGRDQGEPVEIAHRERRLGREHHEHDRQGGRRSRPRP